MLNVCAVKHHFVFKMRLRRSKKGRIENDVQLLRLKQTQEPGLQDLGQDYRRTLARCLTAADPLDPRERNGPKKTNKGSTYSCSCCADLFCLFPSGAFFCYVTKSRQGRLCWRTLVTSWALRMRLSLRRTASINRFGLIKDGYYWTQMDSCHRLHYYHGINNKCIYCIDYINIWEQNNKSCVRERSCIQVILKHLN